METETKTYPYDDGGFTIIGPECFSTPEGSVISWQGANYYKACDHKVVEIEDGAATHCVKRTDHPGTLHEDYEGNTYDEILGNNPDKITIDIPALGRNNEDGSLIHIDRLDVRKAWDAFVKPTQDAKEEMSDETRIVAALLRAVNAALPTVPVKEESSNE